MRVHLPGLLCSQVLLFANTRILGYFRTRYLLISFTSTYHTCVRIHPYWFGPDLQWEVPVKKSGGQHRFNVFLYPTSLSFFLVPWMLVHWISWDAGTKNQLLSSYCTSILTEQASKAPKRETNEGIGKTRCITLIIKCRSSSVGRAEDSSSSSHQHPNWRSIQSTKKKETNLGIERPDARGTSSNAGVAQSVERKTLNLVVEGSSPSFGAFFFFF